jgi:predicted Zn-dependent protease
MNDLNSAVYFPADTSSPLPCKLSMQNQQLYIFPEEAGRSLVIWKAGTYTCSYDGKLFVALRGNERAQCGGSEAYALYDQFTKPAPPQPQKRGTNWYFLWLGIIFAGFIGLLLIAYFLILPWLAEKASSLFPVQQEIALGEQLGKMYDNSGPSIDSADYFANAFLKEINIDSKFPLHLHVIRSKELNAFAIPGGNMYIYSAMLEKMESAEELAALIGHEGSHVTERHAIKSMFRSAASGLVLGAVFGDASDITGWMLTQADQFRQLQYSRGMETEADDKGLQVMKANGIDPHGMIRLLELLQKENSEEPGLMKYLSTHPATKDRIDNIKKQIEGSAATPADKRLEALFMALKKKVK